MSADKMAGYFLQGILSYTGVGGSVDLKSAYNYFSRSGDAMSKAFAAYMQFVGKGTPKDKKKGAILFTRYKKVLVTTDDPFVDWLIGMMYLEGIDAYSYYHDSRPEVIQMPKVNADECTGCGACADACPSDAITVGDVAVIDTNACVECLACVDECPTGAMKE